MENENYREPIDKTKVRITTSGVYTVKPFKAKFKQKNDLQMLEVSFSVELGMNFSCYIDKTIFFRDKEQVKEEINYLLGFIAPELISKEYKGNFEAYANALSADINASIRKSWDNNQLRQFRMKIRVLKNNNYPTTDDYIPKSGSFRNHYIANYDDPKTLWFSKWELNNCVMPFAAVESVGSQGVEMSPRRESEPAFADSFDDLPF